MQTWISTTSQNPWQPHALPRAAGGPGTLTIGPVGGPVFQGFGGCFNELGWEALRRLDLAARQGVMQDLFAAEGCAFTLGRIPIGASDYALEWYSHNEHALDLAMDHFSISRDEVYLLPYIKAAQQVQPDITFFASPWSPPTWMKSPRAYNYGTLIWKPEYLRAYALYFLKFVQAYRGRGISIAQIHPQNEPVADQKFPSCVWTGAQMREFILDYLRPLFARENENVQMWLGTLNTDDFNGWFMPAILNDDGQRSTVIEGVGLQWAGKGMAERIHRAFPDLAIMQTENECGDGKQTWDYAEHVFSLLRHYLIHGASAYVYWNMVLPAGGQSTWGWKQNAMITIDPESGAVVRTHEYYLMKHAAHYIKKGARSVELTGSLAGNSYGFQNPDGQLVIVTHNPLGRSVRVSCDQRFSVCVEPRSFNTFVI